uniref:SFRICE_019680 n=1 Tax=Spodoptera frugiperda TaxID=7108 RepID=A0A2H1VJK4_SPOFR
MALLQLLAWAPPEELLWRATRALARFAAHSHDVPQLIAMVGPDPAAFRYPPRPPRAPPAPPCPRAPARLSPCVCCRGTSPRVDEQIDLIMKRVK